MPENKHAYNKSLIFFDDADWFKSNQIKTAILSGDVGDRRQKIQGTESQTGEVR